MKYLGETEPRVLTHGKVYEVLAIEEKDWYRIIDDDDDDYLYHKDNFELVEN